VVVLVNGVAPFAQISAADVALENLRTVPPGSLTRLDQAIVVGPGRETACGETWRTPLPTHCRARPPLVRSSVDKGGHGCWQLATQDPKMNPVAAGLLANTVSQATLS